MSPSPFVPFYPIAAMPRIKRVKRTILAALTASLGAISVAMAAEPFTVALLPDTQYYSRSTTNIVHFNNQTQWIIDNRVAKNIAMVSHLGDCVENGSNLTEWDRAHAAMSTLDTVPDQTYGVVLGNHDHEGGFDPDDDATNFIAYFGAARFAGRTWYGGDSPDHRNQYHRFHAGGREYLHLVLEYQGASTTNSNYTEVITWAQAVLDANPTTPTILSTHSYLGNGGRTAAGTDMFNALIKGNSQVFMALGGHVLGENHSTVQNDAGKDVFEILSNFQGRANGGNGWMSMLEFDEDNDVINVTTYSPSLDQSETDADSQYSFAVNFDARFGPVWLSSPSSTDVATDQADVHADINQNAAVLKVVWDTIDHGTSSTADWPNVQNLPAWTGGTGQLTSTLTGLGNGTSYVFRFFAANTAVPQEGWSALGTVTTPLTNSPPIMGTPTANSIMGDTATTQCQLTHTSGDVTLVWASADQGATTISAWTGATDGGSHAFGITPQDDVLSHAITGLDPQSTYFFRFFVTNYYGTDWSEVASFTTSDGGTITFQDGVNGYSSTADTWIAIASGSGSGDETDSNFGSGTSIKVEDDPNQSDGQGLIRFDGIFGNGVGKIPLGSTITSATVSFKTGNGFANTPSAPSFHRMLVGWDEGTVTWNSLTGGIQDDGTDALATADDNGGFALANAEVGSWDVLATVQAWSAGATNSGWAILGTTNDGWNGYTSEFATAADRPSLTIEFIAPSDFNSWISDPSFGLDPAEQGIGLDPDSDGLANGIEAWFGTDPGQFNSGIANLTTVGLVSTFTHPQSTSLPDDLISYYEWSPNLVDWYDSSEGQSGGVIITFTSNTIGSTTTVTATASEDIERTFLRAGVNQN